MKDVEYRGDAVHMTDDGKKHEANVRQTAGEGASHRTITFVYQRFNFVGGVERIFSEYVRFFSTNGWRVNVVADEIVPEVAEKCSRIFKLPALKGRSRAGRFFADLITMRRYTRFVRRHRDDLGYVVSIPGASARADAFIAGSCHFASLPSLAAGGRFYVYLNPNHWLCVFNEYFAYKVSAGSKILAPSRRTAEEIRTSYGVSPQRIHLVPFGLDASRFVPVDAATRERIRGGWNLPATDSVVFLIVANEFVRKGVALIIESLPALPDCIVVVAGRDDPSSMQALAGKFGVADRVRFIGSLGAADLTAAYGAADAFIFPTAYESFGMVCIEAMSCGLPVVVTRVGGIEDYVVDGDSGLVVSRTVSAVRTAMEALAKDAELRRRLGGRGRMAAQSYDWAILLRRVPEICEL